MDISKLKDKDREIAELIGADKYALLVNKYGGSNIYIPAPSTVKRCEFAKELKQQYNGDNAAELGKKYNISERTVIRMVTKKST